MVFVIGLSDSGFTEGDFDKRSCDSFRVSKRGPLELNVFFNLFKNDFFEEELVVVIALFEDFPKKPFTVFKNF